MKNIQTLLASALLSLGAAEAPEIRVSPDGWGDADPADVRKVLESTAAALWPQGRAAAVIEVSTGAENPIVLFERGPAGEIRVRLSVQDRRWAQLAFQFAHELGHILCDYAEYPNPNKWFEESVCETASMVALGRMAARWETDPPYPQWKNYAAALARYRRERLDAVSLPEGASLATWYAEHEAALRKNAELRPLNLLAAEELLPLFEAEPDAWSAVAALNRVRGGPERGFRQYLVDWRDAAPPEHRPFVEKIADRFGLRLR